MRRTSPHVESSCEFLRHTITSDVSGKRRSEPIHVPGNDQIMGSFDGMPVKVAFSTLLVYFTPEHERKLVLSLNVTTQRDMARHLVHMAVKAERLHSGPGATAWTLVCERACSVTPRAWNVSPDKVHVSFLRRREDMSRCSKQDAQSHTHRAHRHAHSVKTKL